MSKKSVNVRILTSADQPALEAFLQPLMTSSMLLLGNARQYGLVDRDEMYHGTFAAAFEMVASSDGAAIEGPIVAVAAFSQIGSVLLQAPCSLREVVQAAIEAGAEKHGRKFRGFIGPMAQVDQAEATFNMPHGEAIQTDEREGLYRLPLDELDVPKPLEDGSVHARPIELCDLEIVKAWTLAYRLEAIGSKDTPELRKMIDEGVTAACMARRTWILEAESGQHFGPAAITSFNAMLDEAVQVGGVYTPPELRGMGFARCVVAASLRDARERGASAGVLFTGDQNLPAIHAYQSLGFKRVGDYRLLLLHEPVTCTPAFFS